MSLQKKLAGTGWGANFTTLRTLTLAVAFSTAEYASSAWSHSSHVHKVDTVLNGAMRLVRGALTATPVSNRPVLSGIPPAQLRRDTLTMKHDEDNCRVPALTTLADQRLPRRHFATQAAEMPLDRPTSTIPTWIVDCWSDQWKTTTTSLKEFIPVHSAKPTSCDLPRKAWVNLNRIRTGVGRTQYFLHIIAQL